MPGGQNTMEITQLYYFKAVAKYESFTKAAESLHITQSALSRSIAQLEDDIGFPLFERNKGGRIKLNQNGKFFLVEVTKVLNDLNNTISAVRAMTGLDQGVVNIALSETVFLKNIFYEFLKDYPNIRLNCRLQSNEQIKEGLENGVLNFAVCQSPIIGPTLDWVHLYSDPIMVTMLATHPLAKMSNLHLHELCHEHFIISNIGFGMSSLVKTMCNQAGFEPYVVYEGGGEDLAGMLTAAGLGVMITPYSISCGLKSMNMMEENGAADLVRIPLIDDFAKSEIGIAIKQGQFQSKAAIELYDRIVDFYKNLPYPVDETELVQ